MSNKLTDAYETHCSSNLPQHRGATERRCFETAITLWRIDPRSNLLPLHPWLATSSNSRPSYALGRWRLRFTSTSSLLWNVSEPDADAERYGSYIWTLPYEARLLSRGVVSRPFMLFFFNRCVTTRLPYIPRTQSVVQIRCHCYRGGQQYRIPEGRVLRRRMRALLLGSTNAQGVRMSCSSSYRCYTVSVLLSM